MFFPIEEEDGDSKERKGKGYDSASSSGSPAQGPLDPPPDLKRQPRAFTITQEVTTQKVTAMKRSIIFCGVL